MALIQLFLVQRSGDTLADSTVPGPQGIQGDAGMLIQAVPVTQYSRYSRR
jgi:hypothetical protein